MKTIIVSSKDMTHTWSVELHIYAKEHGYSLATAEDVARVKEIMQLEDDIESSKRMVAKEAAILERRTTRLAELKEKP